MVFTRKSPMVIDLLLQQSTLAAELLKNRVPLLLGLCDDFSGTLACIGDQMLVLGTGLGKKRLGIGDDHVVLGLAGGHKVVVLGLAFGHILVVQLLSESQQASRRTHA